MRLEDRIRSIEAYAHDRYVLGERVTPLDESEAVRCLENHYRSSRNGADPNCGYAGILWFEVSFLPNEDADACLARARVWLERAHELSKTPWPAIEERLTDLRAMQGA